MLEPNLFFSSRRKETDLMIGVDDPGSLLWPPQLSRLFARLFSKQSIRSSFVFAHAKVHITRRTRARARVGLMARRPAPAAPKQHRFNAAAIW